MVDLLTCPINRCCRQSLDEQPHLTHEDGETTICEYSRDDGTNGNDVHRLIRINGEWVMVKG